MQVVGRLVRLDADEARLDDIRRAVEVVERELERGAAERLGGEVGGDLADDAGDEAAGGVVEDRAAGFALREADLYSIRFR